MRPLRILTWHVHGSYLYYLAHTRHEFYLPLKPGHPDGCPGRCGDRRRPDNLIEVPADEVQHLPLDCILYQSHKNYLADQFEILTPSQQQLPRIFLEHDPPRREPTGTRHPVDDRDVLLVHVTAFNALMWDNGRTPWIVIRHGVTVPDDVVYTGTLERGLTIVNGLGTRGRRLGADIFQQARAEVPLDLIGMRSEEVGGLGEVRHRDLPAFVAQYRFLFNPIRYTSLDLAVCEAMMVGLPIVGLATTEMVTTIENGVSGFIDTSVDNLIDRMRELLDNPALARRLGAGARRFARRNFHLQRFVRQWEEAFHTVTGRVGVLPAASVPPAETVIAAPSAEPAAPQLMPEPVPVLVGE